MRQFETPLRENLLKGLEGDAAAYRSFLQQLRDALSPYVARNLARQRQSQLDADDVVQEVVFAVHRKIHTYDGETPVTAWISAIARYKIIDMMRRSSVHDFHDPLEEANDVGLMADVDVQLTLGKAICSLPIKMKNALKLVRIQGLSVREAALAMNATEASIKVSVHRASRLLKALMKP